jgi:hypothetical protein
MIPMSDFGEYKVTVTDEDGYKNKSRVVESTRTTTARHGRTPSASPVRAATSVKRES